jgi:hypothetical protein
MRVRAPIFYHLCFNIPGDVNTPVDKDAFNVFEKGDLNKLIFSSFLLTGCPAAINKKCVTGDESRGGRSEEHNCACDLHRFADSSQGNA